MAKKPRYDLVNHVSLRPSMQRNQIKYTLHVSAVEGLRESASDKPTGLGVSAGFFYAPQDISPQDAARRLVVATYEKINEQIKLLEPTKDLLAGALTNMKVISYNSEGRCVIPANQEIGRVENKKAKA